MNSIQEEALQEINNNRRYQAKEVAKSIILRIAGNQKLIEQAKLDNEVAKKELAELKIEEVVL